MANRRQDPDITADLRMMVPVHYDVERRQAKVWMFLGWLQDSLDVSFERPPEVRSREGRPVSVELAATRYPIATPAVIECLVSRVLDRDEFRELCDRCSTPDEIVRELR